MPIAVMLATLTECRDFGNDWQPRFLGLRDDKPPTEVVREQVG